jgi:hypothetical protein
VPVRGGSLRVRGAGSGLTAHALVNDAPCRATREDGWTSIALPEIDLFDVIVVDYSQKVTQ